MFQVQSRCRLKNENGWRNSHALCEPFLDECLVPLITMKAPIGLRTLEWLLVNYSKTFPVSVGPYLCLKDGSIKTLTVYKRPLFDIFQRSERVHFEWKGKVFHTTVAQLAFLHWCYENKAYDYALEHREDIEGHMSATLRKKKREKKPSKRKALTTARDVCTMSRIKMTLEDDE